MIKNSLKLIDPFAVSAFLLPLFIYLLTLAPSVTFFDSGEFITAISCLGSSHSPGYPFFINYGKPFTWIPFGSIAFRVNFATAVSGALACLGAYHLVVYLLKTEINEDSGINPEVFAKICALSAALTFAFSPRLWLQSNHDKPYPLVAFIVAAGLYLILKWRDSYNAGEERSSYIYAASFIIGLGTGAHHTIILMLPAYALMVVITDWKIIFRFRDLVIAATFGILGFAINLHLPIRATKFPLLNWGNPQTLDQFLWHFLRKGYPMEKVERGFSLLWAQFNAFNVPYEFTAVGFLLMIFGMLFFFRKRKAEVLAYFAALASFMVIIVGYFNTPAETIFLTEEFFTPLYMYSSVFVGLGLFAAGSALLKTMQKFTVTSVATKSLIILIIFILPSAVCALNYVKNDQHLNYVAYDYGSNVIRSVPQGGVLYTWGDSGAFPLWYIQGVERMREDIDIVHTPHLVFSWYLDGFPRLFTNSMLRRIKLEEQSPENILLLAASEQYPTRPVMIDYSTRYSAPFPGYKFVIKGIDYQLLESGSPTNIITDISVWDLYATRGFNGNEMFFRDLDTGKAIMIYANSRIELAEALISESRLGEGIENLRFAARISPEVAGDVSMMLARYGVK